MTPKLNLTLPVALAASLSVSAAPPPVTGPFLGVVTAFDVNVQTGRIYRVHIDFFDADDETDDMPLVGTPTAEWDENIRSARNNQDWITYEVDEYGVITSWTAGPDSGCL